MANDIGLFVGALAITYILIRSFEWLVRKAGQSYFGLAHVLVGAVSIVVAAFGFADGGEPNFLYSAAIYGPACLLWFIIDFYRARRSRR